MEWGGRYGRFDSKWLAQCEGKNLKRNIWFVGGFNQTRFMTFSTKENHLILITTRKACRGYALVQSNIQLPHYFSECTFHAIFLNCFSIFNRSIFIVMKNLIFNIFIFWFSDISISLDDFRHFNLFFVRYSICVLARSDEPTDLMNAGRNKKNHQ